MIKHQLVTSLEGGRLARIVATAATEDAARRSSTDVARKNDERRDRIVDAVIEGDESMLASTP
jgi:hypothetical protein